MKCKVRNYHLGPNNDKIDDGQQINIFFDETMFIVKDSNFQSEFDLGINNIKGKILNENTLYNLEIYIDALLSKYKYEHKLFQESFIKKLEIDIYKNNNYIILYQSLNFDLY